MRISHRLGSALLVLSLALPCTAGASDSAESFVRGRQAELSQLVKTGPAAKKKIETVFDNILDYDSLAKGSLGDNWDARSEAERREFQDVLKQLVQRAYRRNLDRTAAYEVRFDGESPEGQAFRVKTVAQSRSNEREEPVSIDYVVHKAGATWLISDIVTEGSSLVGTYRQQFGRVIKKDGFPELIRRMKRKLATGAE